MRRRCYNYNRLFIYYRINISNYIYNYTPKINKMDLESMNLKQLRMLKIEINNEIEIKTKDYLDSVREIRVKKILNIKYGKQLISYISGELGYDITSKIRSIKYTFPRFTVMEYLRDEGTLLKDIGKLFKMHHSTVIYGMNKYKDLIDCNDLEFYVFSQKVQSLINNFNTLKNKQNGRTN